MGGKLFAVIVIVIALASAVPIISHTFLGASVRPPEDISTHGSDIDKQLDETMIEAGLSFLAAQLVLGFFVWRFGGRKNGPLKNFPGGAKYLVIAAVLFVGTEAIALGALGTKAWGKVFFQPASADALPIQVRQGSSRFISAMQGPMESSGSSIRRRSTKATRISLGSIRRTTLPRAMTSSRASL